MFAIDVQHVAKRFGSTHALTDVSLQVRCGDIVGFLGSNGAGKTTALRGLMGLIRFDSGTARVLDLDPWHDRVALHTRIGYLPSGMGMYARMTGRELLDYTASLAHGSGAASPLRRTALDALEMSDTDLARPMEQYSKGMRQKVAMIQALQHDPELLMMDEPSEGLDPLVQHAVYELLRARAAAGRTILFSSHTLSEVEALCDRVVIVRSGVTVIDASLSELRAQRPRIVRLAVRDAGDALDHLGPAYVRQLDDHAGRAVFEVTAAPDAIVAALAHLHVTDLLIEEPDLEHIFRSYYGVTAAAPAPAPTPAAAHDGGH
ncbi:MAG: ABC transporter ATP-binding protein [Thermoleophilia bacterium]|nr:ABC transporter ATP-binding protein [Thermoleophilia bacterium]